MDFRERNINLSFHSFMHSLVGWFGFLKGFIYLFFKTGTGKKERERNIDVWLPLACPSLETWPTTQACALTGNRTGNPLVLRLVAQSTESHQLRPFSPFESPKRGKKVAKRKFKTRASWYVQIHSVFL